MKNKKNISLPAGVVGYRIQPVSVVLMPERRVRREVRREINLAERNIHKRVQPTAHIPLVNAETLQVHDEDVGGSPQVHLLGGVYIFFAVRAPAHNNVKTARRARSQRQSRLTATDCCPSAAPPPRTLEANFQVSWGQSFLLHKHFLRTRGSGAAVSASKYRWSNQEREQLALLPGSTMRCEQRPLPAQGSAFHRTVRESSGNEVLGTPSETLPRTLTCRMLFQEFPPLSMSATMSSTAAAFSTACRIVLSIFFTTSNWVRAQPFSTQKQLATSTGMCSVE